MNLRDQLQQALGDAYRLERELGGGSMSRVFLGDDLALGRKIVVKVLSPELAAGVSSERFTREIRMAARLQQANIVPLLAAGETDGLPYYTMPYVDGQSLRLRLARGPLGIAEVVNVLRDVARALAYAHDAGIIHRDIKPENVLLSGGAAVVTDFGIAKAITVSRSTEASATITSIGSTVGTPAYMAPEQALADPNADHRVDIYSFGCLAYELLTGHVPFHGRSVQRQLVAHVQETPVPVERVRPDTPGELSGLVARCLGKEPSERPQSAPEILEALDSVTTPLRTGRVMAIRRRPRRTAALIATATVVAVSAIALGAKLVLSASFGRPRAIAVLPFANVGADSAQQYFAEGMGLDLTTALSKVEELRVTSRSLAAMYQGKAVDVRTVGRDLHVDAVVEGAVQRVPGRVRVTAQLTRTSDGVALWSNVYEQDIKDVFAVQDQITREILSELRLTLSGKADAARPLVAGTASIDAYDAYLRGIYLLEHRGPGVAKSVEYFKTAIARDSGLARAWGALSEALELTPYFASTRPSTIEAQAVAAAERALALDSTVTEAYIGLGLARSHAFRWNEAEAAFRRAVAVDSNSSVAHVQYGRHLMLRGRIREATAEFRRATQLDPVSGTGFVWLAHMYSLNGQLDSAVLLNRHARDVDPGLVLARAMGGVDATDAGRPNEARAIVTGIEGAALWRGEAALTLGRVGDTTAARATIDALERLPADTWLIHSALAYAYIGVADTAQALTELERAVAAREITPSLNPLAGRMYDGVRASPRFAGVVRGFGLDVPLLTSTYGGRPAK